MQKVIDPFVFQETFWPNYYFFSKQKEIVESFEHNTITVVPACNKVGKDFIAGWCALSMFLRYKECRGITTSIRDDHLRVLFGEIERHINNCRFPLRGPLGCLKIKHRDIRKIVNGQQCSISYMRGLVSEKTEGFAGHHARWTFAILDEASGIDDSVLDQILTWAKRVLIIARLLTVSNPFSSTIVRTPSLRDRLNIIEETPKVTDSSFDNLNAFTSSFRME